MKVKKIHIAIATAILSLIVIAGCSRSIDYNDGEPVMFSELPKEVQDTLIWWGEHTIVSGWRYGCCGTGRCGMF